MRLAADICLQQEIYHRQREGLQSKRGYENIGGGRVQLGLKGERSLRLGSGGWEKQKTRLGW